MTASEHDRSKRSDTDGIASRSLDRLVPALLDAEQVLRARGLTGAQAFRVLLEEVRLRRSGSRSAPCQTLSMLDEFIAPGCTDLLGLAYERFFPDLFKARHGQYFTPGPLVDFVLDLAAVQPGETVLDPTCGSGSFLLGAGRRGARVFGYEINPSLSELARVNLELAGIPGVIETNDVFLASPEPASLVVANPPFSVQVTDPALLERFGQTLSGRPITTDALFWVALEQWVTDDGRAAVVMPWSFLVNQSWRVMREYVRTRWDVQRVCALPEGVFRPFGGATGRACILWIRRVRKHKGGTLWGSIRDPGYNVRLKRYQATDATEMEALATGVGWRSLPQGDWVPSVNPDPPGPRKRVSELAEQRRERIDPQRRPDWATYSVNLADADKRTGEVELGTELWGRELLGARWRIHNEDVLVSRMRPDLGNVAIVVGTKGECIVGSREWIVLGGARWPYFLKHALRTDGWRARLPETEGQTRPRTTGNAVLSSEIAWPGERIAASIDTISRRLHHIRDEALEDLKQLQEALDAFDRGELSNGELQALVGRLMDATSPT